MDQKLGPKDALKLKVKKTSWLHGNIPSLNFDHIFEVITHYKNLAAKGIFCATSIQRPFNFCCVFINEKRA